jgi:hypothetical protein
MLLTTITASCNPPNISSMLKLAIINYTKKGLINQPFFKLFM